MTKKILLSLLSLLLIVILYAYLYFTAGVEVYPTGLPAGRIAPDFSGSDQHGQQLQLSELIRKGPVVLVFYRGLWCPACQQHLEELQLTLDQFVAKGASVIAVTPETTEQTLLNIPVKNSSISIIHDRDNAIMNSFQVGYEPGKGSMRLFNVMGIDLEEANGNDQSTLPIPALYVIGRDGSILFSYEKAGGFVPAYLPVADILDQLSD